MPPSEPSLPLRWNTVFTEPTACAATVREEAALRERGFWLGASGSESLFPPTTPGIFCLSPRREKVLPWEQGCRPANLLHPSGVLLSGPRAPSQSPIQSMQPPA